MKKIVTIVVITFFAFASVKAQNVGINQNNPTNSLHITPVNTGDSPLRIDGLQPYSVGDTSLLIINNLTGIVKYIPLSSIASSISNDLLSNQDFNDSIISILYNNADTLLYNNSFINNLRDSIDSDIDSVNLTGTVLTVYENGNNASVNLSSLSDNDGDPTNEIELPPSAVSGQVLAWDGSNWVAQNSASGADNWGTQTVVSGSGFSGDGTTGTPLNYTETDGSITNELQTLTTSGSNVTLSNGGGTISNNDADSNPTNEHNTNVTLSGNTLNILDGGGTISIDLTPLINTAVSNAVPPGTVNAHAGSSVPSGYLICDGSAVSRTTYADLFGAIGTMYGNGNGSTTFNLPNYTGQFLRGVDNGQGTDLDAATRTDRGDGTTGDAVGTKQANQTLAHNHAVNPPATNSNSAGNHLHSVDPPNTNTNLSGAHAHNVDPPNTATTTNGSHNHGSRTGGISTFNSSTYVPFDDNLSQSTTNANTAAPTNCGSPFNGQGTIGNFMGRLNSSCLAHTHTISTDGNHNHTVNIAAFNSSNTGNHTHAVNIGAFNSSTTGNHLHTTDIPQFNSANNGGNETRPTNISVLWCIKF